MFGCVLISVFMTNASFGSLQPGSAVFDVSIAGPMAIWALIVGLLIGTLASIFNTSVWTLAYRQWRAAQVVRPVLRPDEV
jgi:TctA family transporter